jgi:lysophospholipase L1-like esterase
MNTITAISAWVLAAGLTAASGAARAADGDDLLAPFAQAHAGQPLTAVAIGSSITAAGGGWIGGWLKSTFPQTEIKWFNAGISGTGPSLGVYRVERDVIARNPDLVLIEFVANSGRDQEQIAWQIESVVRRLKSLPHPPGIVMVEVAGREEDGKTLWPPAGGAAQRAVAQHYKLLNVDLQTAVKQHLLKTGLTWDDVMPDGGHPNAKGHKLYQDIITAALQPFVDRAAGGEPAAPPGPLPPVMSPRKLMLDGALLPVPSSGKWQRGPLRHWSSETTSCREEGAVLTIPFRGSAVGVLFAAGLRNGIARVSVDGAPPVEIDTGYTGGHTTRILNEALVPGDHLLHLVIPRGGGARDDGVHLGSIMVGGSDGAPAGLVPQGAYTPERLAQERLDPATEKKLAEEKIALTGGVPAGKWAWVGPFGDLSRRLSGDSPLNDKTLHDLNIAFWPEAGMSSAPNRKPAPEAERADLTWKRGDAGSGTMLNFRSLTGYLDRGVAYAWTVVESTGARTVRCRLEIDYFGKIWVNGKLIHRVGGHGGVGEGVWFDLPLAAGTNHLLVKTHAGSAGFSLAASVVANADQPVTFTNPLDFQAEASGLALRNAFTKCLTAKKLTIVIIGNSVSAPDNGYPAHLRGWFEKTFPEAKIEVKRGIISSIGSEVQLFRMDDKLFAHAPDLVVAEFGAANTAADSAWGEPGKITRQSLEGYVRRLRRQRPEADLLLNHSIHQSGMEAYRQGGVPDSVAFHRQVAAYYGCALAESGTEIARRVIAGEPWSAFMGDPIHPNAGGYAVHGEVIRAELDRQYKLYLALADQDRGVRAHALPDPILPNAWEDPQIVPATAAADLAGFTEGASGRVRYIEASAAGASGRFAPDKGRIVGIWRHCGRRDAPLVEGEVPRLEVRLDGVGEWTPLPLGKEPVVVDDDDRDNLLRRQFFGAYGLPLDCRSLEFRAVANSGEAAAAAPARIVGFFVVK